MKTGPGDPGSAGRENTTDPKPVAAEAARAALPERAELLGLAPAELTPRVREAIDLLFAEIARLSRELADAGERVAFLERLADEDVLVPVVNRRAFVRELGRMISFAKRYGTKSALIYLDIQGMKAINDRFGHKAGDRVLAHVADAIKNHIRDGDMVGRIGGDEFGVILVQADPADAARKAEALAAAIAAAAVELDGQKRAIAVSYGVYPIDAEVTATTAMDAADRDMYERRRGKPA
jgi:diguanylate cyclase (GGDEF)-like protein